MTPVSVLSCQWIGNSYCIIVSFPDFGAPPDPAHIFFNPAMLSGLNCETLSRSTFWATYTEGQFDEFIMFRKMLIIGAFYVNTLKKNCTLKPLLYF